MPWINTEHPLGALVGRFVESMRARRDAFAGGSSIDTAASATLVPTESGAVVNPYEVPFGVSEPSAASLGGAANAADEGPPDSVPFGPDRSCPEGYVDGGAACALASLFSPYAPGGAYEGQDPYATPFGVSPEGVTDLGEPYVPLGPDPYDAEEALAETRSAYEDCQLAGGDWRDGLCYFPTKDTQADDILGQEDTTPGLLLAPIADPLAGKSSAMTFGRLVLIAALLGGAAWGVTAIVKRKRKGRRRAR